MQNRTAIVVTIAAAVLALVVPVLLVLHVGRRDALQTEEQRALLYADVILKRSERVAGQADAAFRALAASGVPACSDAGLALMRQIQLTSSYIDALGYTAGNRLLCSSVGSQTRGLDLGPPTLVQPSGVTIRTGVRFPFSKDVGFMLIGRGNFVAIIHNELAVDVVTASKDVRLAIFAVPQKRILVAHGAIDPAWIAALHGRREAVFESDGHTVAVVAVLTSLHYYVGAISALPTSEVNQQFRKSTSLLVPSAIVGTIVLLLAVLQLARILVSMPALIKAALKRNEFSLNYQPVVDLRTGQWIGAEALIRWRLPRGEVIRPDLFIPIAEDCGLIQRVTERVTEILADDAATVFRRFPDFHIGINLTPHDLRSTATIELLERLARRANAKPGNLMIEVTERSLMDPAVAGQTIRELKAQGFVFAIDDFGIGYSSLSYLGNFDFDLLKIDKSFVEALDTDSATSHVVPHIIEMAKALKLDMIAEGVETEAQAQFMRDHGVQYAQGWLFAKAMPLADLLAEMGRAKRHQQARPAPHAL